MWVLYRCDGERGRRAQRAALFGRPQLPALLPLALLRPHSALLHPHSADCLRLRSKVPRSSRSSSPPHLAHSSRHKMRPAPLQGTGRPGPPMYRNWRTFVRDARHNRLLVVPAALYAVRSRGWERANVCRGGGETVDIIAAGVQGCSSMHCVRAIQLCPCPSPSLPFADQ